MRLLGLAVGAFIALAAPAYANLVGGPPAVITPPGIPAPAAAAGYTDPVNVTDFTKPLPTNWLGSCPNGPDSTFNLYDYDGTHRWWAGWGFYGQSWTCNKLPANDPGALPGAGAGGSFQDRDPVFGNLALHQTTNSDDTDYNWDSGAQMGTTTPASNANNGQDYTLTNGFNQHNDYPNGFYIEEVYRLSPTNGTANGGNPVGPFQGLNSWTTQGLFDQSKAGLEWDSGETQTSFGGVCETNCIFNGFDLTGQAYGGMDGAVHNWACDLGPPNHDTCSDFVWTAFLQPPPNITNWDFNGYNRVGLLVTSDGSTDIVGCFYYGPEAGPVVSPGCVSIKSIGPPGYTIPPAQFAQRLAFELQTACGPHGAGPDGAGIASPCPPVGTHGDNYVKSIGIYICQGGEAGDGHACDRPLITTPPPYQ